MARYILQYARHSRHHRPLDGSPIPLLSLHPNGHHCICLFCIPLIITMQFNWRYWAYLVSGVGEWWLSEGRQDNLNFIIRRPLWKKIASYN